MHALAGVPRLRCKPAATPPPHSMPASTASPPKASWLPLAYKKNLVGRASPPPRFPLPCRTRSVPPSKVRPSAMAQETEDRCRWSDYATNTAFANYSPGVARVTSDFISGITGAYIRHGITNSQINFRDAAAESLGNALGNEIVGGLIRKEETSKALAFDYSLAEGEAKAPGLRLTNRDADAFDDGIRDMHARRAYWEGNGLNVQGLTDDEQDALNYAVPPAQGPGILVAENTRGSVRAGDINPATGHSNLFEFAHIPINSRDFNHLGRTVKGFVDSLLFNNIVEPVGLVADTLFGLPGALYTSENPADYDDKGQLIYREPNLRDGWLNGVASDDPYRMSFAVGDKVSLGLAVAGGVGLAAKGMSALRAGGVGFKTPVSSTTADAAASGSGVFRGSNSANEVGRVLANGATDIVRGVDPRTLNRSHEISGRSSSNRVNDIADDMRRSGYSGPPIDVVEHGGQFYIIDGHHRAAAARRTGIAVDIRIVRDVASHPSNYRSVNEVVYDAQLIGPDRITHPNRYKK